jgi:hypothetical protein
MEVELGNINMSQEPEVVEEEPSVEATCDDPEVGTWAKSTNTITKVCRV